MNMDKDALWEEFGQAVYAKRQGVRSDRKTLGELAEAIGIPHHRLRHIEAGGEPNVLDYLKLCRWLGRDAYSILENTNV
jgi:hypothetical protein